MHKVPWNNTIIKILIAFIITANPIVTDRLHRTFVGQIQSSHHRSYGRIAISASNLVAQIHSALHHLDAVLFDFVFDDAGSERFVRDATTGFNFAVFRQYCGVVFLCYDYGITAGAVLQLADLNPVAAVLWR